jgi:hypothetical protein
MVKARPRRDAGPALPDLPLAMLTLHVPGFVLEPILQVQPQLR